MRFVLMAALIASFLFFGLVRAEAKASPAAKKKAIQQTLDLDNDGSKEVVKVEDKFDSSQNFTVTILNNRKEELDSFSAMGRFKKIELVDLEGNNTKQVAVYYKDPNDFYSLIIYQLKDKSLYKIFGVSSIYGIDAELDTNLPRIKVGKAKYARGSGYSSDIPEWEVWVWVQDRFVKER